MLSATRVEVLNVLPYASTLEYAFGEVIKPPAIGLYLRGVLNPVLVQGEVYFNVTKTNSYTTYVDKRTGQHLGQRPVFESVPILPGSDISAMTGEITDSSGNVVIPSYAMAAKERYLSNMPFLPYRGVEIARCIIEEYISRLTCHGWKIDSENTLRKLLYCEPDRDGIKLWKDGFMERALENLLIQVTDFIGPDTYHIYFVKTRGYEVIIEKTVDYRAWQWVKHQEEQELWRHRHDDV